MEFDKHLFISYAHIDNQPLPPEEQGWISRFHKSLESVLSMRLGVPAKIWRDEKLRGNDVFAEEIVGQFPHTALLVSVHCSIFSNTIRKVTVTFWFSCKYFMVMRAVH